MHTEMTELGYPIIIHLLYSTIHAQQFHNNTLILPLAISLLKTVNNSFFFWGGVHMLSPFFPHFRIVVLYLHYKST